MPGEKEHWVSRFSQVENGAGRQAARPQKTFNLRQNSSSFHGETTDILCARWSKKERHGNMAFTLTSTNWKTLTSVTSPGSSANPVLKLTAGTSILWAKAAPGGKRVAFAGNVMGRVGFNSTGTRVVEGTELAVARSAMAAKVADTAKGKLQQFEDALDDGCDFILMQNVSGVEFAKHMNAIPDNNAAIAEFLRILGTSTIQDDIARLIAADLLLGNFDRIAYNATQDSAKFHSGNFIFEAGRFLPIDNDTVAPSAQHIRTPQRPAGTKTSSTPTNEHLYYTVIKGAVLNQQTTGAFPAAEQASMDAMLGANAVDAIAAALAGMFGSTLSTTDKATLRGYAQTIAPKVRTVMQTLIAECKTPGGGRTGLNALMKAHNNLEGMNYTTFKVKARFADLLVNGNKSESEATGTAIAYGKYRDWKNQFDEYLTALPNYDIPVVRLRSLGTLEKFKRGANSAAAAMSKVLPADLVDRSLEQVMRDAKGAKKDLRKNNPDEAKLRQLYTTWHTQSDSDNRILKVKTLIVANLLRIDLLKLNAFIMDILLSAPSDGVARFFGKAITKRRAQTKQLVDAYSSQVNALKPSLDVLSSEEKQLVGTTALASLVEELKTNLYKAASL